MEKNAMGAMTYNEFKDFIYLMAGSSYHQIEVPADVFEKYCVRKALNKFIEFHMDGSTMFVYPLELQKGVTTYTLPDDICSVTSVLSTQGALNPSVSPTRLFREDMLRCGVSSSVADYSMFSGWLSQMRITLNPYYYWNWNRLLREFSIYNPAQVPSSHLFLECWKDHSVTDIGKIYANPLFQELTLALLYQMWARSLMKYNRALVGGSELNWKDIEENGKELWEKTVEVLKEENMNQAEFLFG